MSLAEINLTDGIPLKYKQLETDGQGSVHDHRNTQLIVFVISIPQYKISKII